MNIYENFRVALRALSANKLRSSLTMLGIIIGVGAVVALMAIGQGATASITGQIQGIGANLITIFPGRLQGGPQAGAAAAFLYYADYEFLARELGRPHLVVPVFQDQATVKQDQTSLSVSIYATNADFAVARAYTMEHGRFLTDADERAGTRVAVLGSQTATDLFGPLNPLGREIRVNDIRFTVVGIFASKGSSGFGSDDELVVIPLETGYDKLFGTRAMVNGKRRVAAIFISAASAEEVDAVMAEANKLLRRAHGLKPRDENDFSVLSQSSILSTLGTITATLTVFLGSIAGISLLVGGIGIMNIMLVSVTERTKEIGLRKAVGAKRSAIMLQFLIETLVLSLLGGSIGIFLGWSVAALVRAADLIEAQVTLDSVLLAFGFSAAVGIFFGLYPAWRASRLRPIEALRYE